MDQLNEKKITQDISESMTILKIHQQQFTYQYIIFNGDFLRLFVRHYQIRIRLLNLYYDNHRVFIYVLPLHSCYITLLIHRIKD